MIKNLTSVLFFFIAISFLSQKGLAVNSALIQAPADSAYNHLYEKGKKLAAKHPVQALNTWLSAKNFGKTPDPRIGIRFIETVTKNKLNQYESQASAMYFWGLSGTVVATFHDELAAELQRLRPLMKDDFYNKLHDLLDENDPLFYKELRLFWETHDPMPSTLKNEYLLTIWHRIAFARKNFKNGHYSPYGTDARGPVYVKYGKPDRTYQNRQIDLNLTSPDILFWIYEPKTVRANRRVIYIFGTIPKQQQRYGIIKSLDELIPRKLNREPGGYDDAAIAFRARLYKKYQTIDPFFSRELVLMKISGPKANTRSYIASNKARTTANLEARKSDAKPVIRPSNIADFKSNIKTYHFFNANRQPYSIALMYSFPKKVLAANKYNEALQGSSSQKVISHTLQIINPEEDSLQKMEDVPGVALSELSRGSRDFPAISVFKLSNIPVNVRLHAVAEIIAYSRKKQARDQISFIGLHDESETLDRTRSATTDRWQLSDAIIGYQDNGMKINNNPFSFYPAPDRRIPRTKDLRLYFELYDFSGKGHSKIPYQVSYNIEDKKGLIGKILGAQSNQKITLNLTKSHPIEPNYIEIKTSELPPDDYVLKFTVLNPATGDELNREIAFSIE